MWNPVNADLTTLQVIDGKIRELHTGNLTYLPDFSDSSTLFVGSDYAGEHRKSSYLALAFLILPLNSWRAWDLQRVAIRQRHRVIDRRIGYARLGDRGKRRIASEFLRVIGNTKGLLVTVLIRKTLRSILDSAGHIDKTKWQVEHCTAWKEAALEKMLRVAHFVAFLIAGMSTTNQVVRWITDQDDIAPNEPRFHQMSTVFAAVVSRYLTHTLRHLTCSTTAESPLEVEDFVAIPDLAAGALAELFNAYADRQVSMSEQLVLPRPDTLPGKTHEILDWLASAMPLRRLVYTVDPGPEKDTIHITDINIGGASLIERCRGV